jgi:hypothetical protein
MACTFGKKHPFWNQFIQNRPPYQAEGYTNRWLIKIPCITKRNQPEKSRSISFILQEKYPSSHKTNGHHYEDFLMLKW